MKHLIREIRRHPINFIFLFILFSVSAFLFYLFRYDHHDQRRVIYVTGGLYLGWSLYHHYRRGDLSLTIFIEYLLLALFGLIVALTTVI